MTNAPPGATECVFIVCFEPGTGRMCDDHGPTSVRSNPLIATFLVEAQERHEKREKVYRDERAGSLGYAGHFPPYADTFRPSR